MHSHENNKKHRFSIRLYIYNIYLHRALYDNNLPEFVGEDPGEYGRQ